MWVHRVPLVESSIGASDVGLGLCCIRRSHQAGAALGCCLQVEVSFTSAATVELAGAWASFLVRQHALDDYLARAFEGCLVRHCLHSLIHADGHVLAIHLGRWLPLGAAAAASP